MLRACPCRCVHAAVQVLQRSLAVSTKLARSPLQVMRGMVQALLEQAQVGAAAN